MPPRTAETTPLGSKNPSPAMTFLVDDRQEIAFFDVETTVPTRAGQGHALLEFGAILVCPRKLEEIRTYSTLIRPANPSLITSLSVRCNGITPDAVANAPAFHDIADTVYDILHGRVWAGHNIGRFDVARIREAFNEIGRIPPEPKGIIDTLPLLTQKFGRRAGDMKAILLFLCTAYYFFYLYVSLEDVKMNIEVVKHCATVLFLESSLPEIFTEYSWVSPNATTRSRRNERSSPEGTGSSMSSSSQISRIENVQVESPADFITEENHPISSLRTSNTSDEGSVTVQFTSAQPDSFNLSGLRNQINADSFVPDVNMEETAMPESLEMHATVPEFSADTGFLGPDEVSISSIRPALFPFFRGTQKLKLLHNNVILQLCCPSLRVRFGISGKFLDNAGRPRLNFVVDAPPSLWKVLDACDDIAKKFLEESGSDSEWRCIVSRKKGFLQYPLVRLHITNALNGEFATDIQQKQSSGAEEKLEFSKYDAGELEPLFQPGNLVDAYFSLDAYDYQQAAGIRLVAKKLIIHKQ
ncbi:hypothetical protein Tsubulata_009398 [Turnera subulata]|uniref:Exonuclease domain-containing protein n=1 Tax=Turnera subulata TaxID=218843 RepID=A0A9Q0FZZ8_9ROSI|nr:hypothetical protein Tsubulata_009398 [Turnera subulata]